MINPCIFREAVQNRTVKTAWSPDIVVTDVLLTFQTGSQVFYGVKTINTERSCWVWPDTDGLLWVIDGGDQLRTWQEDRQGPYIPYGRPAYEIEHVIGYYHSETGNTYAGIKWKGYTCPTWEAEAEVDRLLFSDTMAIEGFPSPYLMTGVYAYYAQI
ncbi:hypothetical protein FSARC_7379 [Fusarium sarcochroum]|uniref:Chromo domain-containing protein n=1 Tax=Fusarium sarcochroum TaxID=1208366 RepID=A0A8H4TVF7_9HYPO|nr:hypothetical protein FSARC_7379 [Fusarium sarcochroum]